MVGKPGDKSNWSWESLIPELCFNRPVGGWIITQHELKQSNTILQERVPKKRVLRATLVFVHISQSGCLLVSMALDLPTWKNNPSFEQYQNHYLCPAIRQQTYIFQPLPEAIGSSEAETMHFGTWYQSAVSQEVFQQVMDYKLTVKNTWIWPNDKPPAGLKFKTGDTTDWWGHRVPGALRCCWWECQMVQPLWKTVKQFLKKVQLTQWPSNSTHEYLSKRKEHVCPQKGLCKNVRRLHHKVNRLNTTDLHPKNG